MVRIAVFFVMAFFLQGCFFCIISIKPKNAEGYIRKKGLNKYSFDAKSFKKLDTLSLYEELSYYEYEGKTLKRDSLNGKTFLRFYGNGKVSFFVRIGYDRKKYEIIPNYHLTRDDFNPSKSVQGYYYNVKDELFLKTIYGGDCFVLKEVRKLFIKGDTVVLLKKYYKSYYVKKKVNKKLLTGWEPDW